MYIYICIYIYILILPRSLENDQRADVWDIRSFFHYQCICIHIYICIYVQISVAADDQAASDPDWSCRTTCREKKEICSFLYYQWINVYIYTWGCVQVSMASGYWAACHTNWPCRTIQGYNAARSAPGVYRIISLNRVLVCMWRASIFRI